MRIKVLAVVAAAVMLSGCATFNENMANARNEQAQVKSRFAATRPACQNEQQCEKMWAAARNWVINNCGMKIQNITDGYIETYGSTGTQLACRVTKDPMANGNWQLTVTTGCNNMFGCIPDAWQAALNFNEVVGAVMFQTAPPLPSASDAEGGQP
jgi:hypothetical protein